MNDVFEDYKKREDFAILMSYWDNSYFNNLRKEAKKLKQVFILLF